MYKLQLPQITIVAILILIFTTSIKAEVPNYVNYQGRVTDDGGQPVNGSKFMKFKIYGSPSEDDSLWSSGLQAIMIVGGLFDYKLGSNVALPEDLFKGNNPRYLGVTVDTDVEIAPRIQFITVPFAYHAAISDSASPDSDWEISGYDIYRIDGNVGIGVLPSPEAVLHINATSTHGIEVLSTTALSAIEASNNNTRSFLTGDAQAVFGEQLAVNEHNFGGLGHFEYGAFGFGDDEDDIGVYGENDNSRNYGYLGSDSIGVFGHAESTADYAGYFEGKGYFSDNVGIGVLPSPEAVLHINATSTHGIEVLSTTALSAIEASNNNTRSFLTGDAQAVFGEQLAVNEHNFGGLGHFEYGAFGFGDDEDDIGVYGENDNSRNYGYLGSDSIGVFGYAETSNDYAGYFDGNVYVANKTGLGTKSIEGKLDINDSEDSDLIIFETDGTNRFGIYAHGTGNDHLTFRSKLENPDSDILTIMANKRIGINKTDPQDALDVGGNIRLDNGPGTGVFLRFAEDDDLKWTFMYRPWHDSNLVLFDESGGGVVMGFGRATGYVGIGVEYPSEQLHVGGNICYTGSIGACSDIRYKTNISTLSNSLEKILKIRGVSFNWRADKFPENDFSKNDQVGFIAQELKEVFPQVVSEDNNGFYNVDYTKLTPLLIEAIKEQQEQIETLSKRIEEIEGNR